MATTLTKGVSYQADAMNLAGWTEGDGSGHEGYTVDAYFDADGEYQGADQHGIEPLFDVAVESEDADEIIEKSLFLDADQGETKSGKAFGFIGTNDADDYQGWFFTWPSNRAIVTTAAEVESVIDSLDADETCSNEQQIPLEWAKAKLEMFLEKFPLTRKISISGNWRKGGPENEWAGDGTVDSHGIIECAANIGDQAYDAIQEQISDGDTDGEVTIHSEEQDRDITYAWAITE